MDQYDIINNPAEGRFEINTGRYLAYLWYELGPGYMIFNSTEVPPAFEGQGIGSALARAGLDYARENNLAVVVLCPFVQSFIQHHPEYQDLNQN